MSQRSTKTTDSDCRSIEPDAFDFSAETTELQQPAPAANKVDEPGWIYRYQLLIRRSDQFAVFFLTAVSLVLMIAYFFYRSHVENGLIEIDRSGRISPAIYQVDINHADWPEFDNLPGIGTAMAKAIIEFRNTNGPFQTHEQLGSITGIGDSTIEKLKPHLAPIDDSAEILHDNGQ